MAEEEQETFPQKLLFYTTAFFILLGTFSLFAFLFLVPFVIDPAFTTIALDFDTRPALCVTIGVVSRRGDNKIQTIYQEYFKYTNLNYDRANVEERKIIK